RRRPPRRQPRRPAPRVALRRSSWDAPLSYVCPLRRPQWLPKWANPRRRLGVDGVEPPGAAFDGGEVGGATVVNELEPCAPAVGRRVPPPLLHGPRAGPA